MVNKYLFTRHNKPSSLSSQVRLLIYYYGGVNITKGGDNCCNTSTKLGKSTSLPRSYLLFSMKRYGIFNIFRLALVFTVAKHAGVNTPLYRRVYKNQIFLTSSLTIRNLQSSFTCTL